MCAEDAKDDTSKICCCEHEMGPQKVIEYHGGESGLSGARRRGFRSLWPARLPLALKTALLPLSYVGRMKD